jgi:hypothetical protein
MSVMKYHPTSCNTSEGESCNYTAVKASYHVEVTSLIKIISYETLTSSIKNATNIKMFRASIVRRQAK